MGRAGSGQQCPKYHGPTTASQQSEGDHWMSIWKEATGIDVRREETCEVEKSPSLRLNQGFGLPKVLGAL